MARAIVVCGRLRPFAVLLTAVSLGLGACAPRIDRAAPSPPQSVEVAQVASPANGRRLTVVGVLAHRREMALSFRAAGALTAVSAQPGDFLPAGATIATINATPMTAANQQARVEYERARRDLERDQTLFGRGFVSQQRVQDRQSALTAAEAVLKSTTFDERSARITAPAHSVVLQRLAEVGEVVQAGQPVVQLADLSSPLIVRGALPDRDVAKVRLGDAATIRLDSRPGAPLRGVVARLGQQADSRTGVVLVEIEIRGPSDGLRSGEIVTATIAARAAPAQADYARVPPEALIEARGQQASVMLVGAGDVARRAVVRFGGFDGDDALVAGLAEDARVITAGAGLLTDGQRVRVSGGSSAAR